MPLALTFAYYHLLSLAGVVGMALPWALFLCFTVIVLNLSNPGSTQLSAFYMAAELCWEKVTMVKMMSTV